MINDPVIPNAQASPSFLSNVSVPVLISLVFRAHVQQKEGAGRFFLMDVLARVLISVANPRNPSRPAFTFIAPVQRI